MDNQGRDKSNFSWYYDKLCALQDSCPLANVQANLVEDFIDCNADRIRCHDWNPIIDALRVNSSLKFIAFRSTWQPSKSNFDGSAEPRVYTLRKRIPAIRNKSLAHKLCRALQECLCCTQCLECVILQGIPLRENDVTQLAKGVLKNSTLKYLSLEFCQIGDLALQVLCTSIRKSTSLTSINFSGCNLTWRAGEAIGSLIQNQGTRRYGEAWEQSLRYRTPDLNSMLGIRRITLNHNILMGDKFAFAMAEALKDDLWIKALDLQQCGITTEGAKAFLTAMEVNQTIGVLDLRQNTLIDKETLTLVTNQAKSNAGIGNPEYPWISTKQINTVKGRGKKKSVRFSVKRKMALRRFQGCPKSTEHKPLGAELQDGSRQHIPWRVQARLEENRGRRRNPLRAVQAFTAMQATEESNSRPVKVKDNPSPESNRKMGTKIEVIDLEDDSSYSDDLKTLRIELEVMKRKLASEARDRVKSDARIHELESENRRLRNEILLLKTPHSKDEQNRHKGAKGKNILDDDTVLESIEASFRQFQAFLDLLKASGFSDLNNLLSQAAEKEQRTPAEAMPRSHDFSRKTFDNI